MPVVACLALAGCSTKTSEPIPPPVLSPIGSKAVMEGDLLTFGVSAQGGGDMWPELSTSTLPTGADFTDHFDGTGTFDWIPSTSQAGNYSILFRARANGLTDSELVHIQVTSLPPAPPKDTVYIGSDTVLAGDTAEVDLVLVNPDSSVAGLNIWLHSEGGLYFDTLNLSLRYPPADGMSWVTSCDSSIGIMSLLMVDFNPPLAFVPPGSGPLFKLRFAVPASTPPGIYAVDTTSQIVPNGLDLSYRSGLSVPNVGFVPGQIVVQ